VLISQAPEFWWKPRTAAAIAMWPLSLPYGMIAAWRMRNAKPAPAPLPVICVGNVTVGGSGKTPLAIELARTARARGLKAGFITRGHGGSIRTTRLALAEDTATEAGDEALLLLRHGPVAVGDDRLRAASLLKEAGADIAIMDDGFQSRAITIDHALIAVDARRGAGNGLVFPAGPLRAPLAAQIAFADQFIVTGEGGMAATIVRPAARAGKPVSSASFEAKPGHKLRDRRVLAFAGIADPGKFFATLEGLGARVVQTRAFPDHHPFAEEELVELLRLCTAGDLHPVTTEKDAGRLAAAGRAGAALLQEATILAVRLKTMNDNALNLAISQALERFARRTR
jgi:tetraacyldisaccharide 4'-kinase